MKKLSMFVFCLVFPFSAFAADVMISSEMKSVDITLNGESFTIMRNQEPGKIHPLYETTHRGKPQPIILAPGVETLGELEFIDFMVKAQNDKSILVIDTRTAGWYADLRIPGAVNIPNSIFDDRDDAVFEMTTTFGVEEKDDGSLDFSNAKTIVAYCNGYWCGQTPMLIKNAEFSLLNMGYPPEKLKYYRGGMQAWTSLGLTVVGDKAQ
jgi:rhodanese-related sulfurtransferase